MARAVAGGFVFFVVLAVIVGVPATLGGVLGLSTLSLPAAIIFTFLLGFLTGTVKDKFLEDNVTTTIISTGFTGFAAYFTDLGFWQAAVIFVVAYFAGRNLNSGHH